MSTAETRKAWSTRWLTVHTGYLPPKKVLKKNATNIIPAVRTDHDAISLELGRLEDELKGPGNWKMNCSLLGDEDYEEDITRMIPLWIAEDQKEFADN